MMLTECLSFLVSSLWFLVNATHFKTTQKLITVGNSSCGKVMFSQVSVCPQWRGVHPLILLGRHPSLGRHPLGRHPLADTPRQTLYPLGRHLPWTDTPLLRPPSPTRWPLQRMVRILLECIWMDGYYSY